MGGLGRWGDDSASQRREEVLQCPQLLVWTHGARRRDLTRRARGRVSGAVSCCEASPRRRQFAADPPACCEAKERKRITVRGPARRRKGSTFLL
ncbi:hypothetical protein SKAU_G00036760 [Synaphobranchus kaupii]|uniref:Uncharacterized protein n=1 Tax=Synaphobranchus kaupii TaxID=118154 RepID=A0A9Q1GG30_SYNKA|nr:hypothetical protein SKAU_G00036760 [Synaphobranchus kaupii]